MSERDVLLARGWVSGAGAALQRRDPARGEISWSGHAASGEQVRWAVADARVAQREWAGYAQEERSAVMRAYAERLRARREEMAISISRDMGKPLWESRTEVDAMIGKIAISIEALHARAGETRVNADFGSLELRHRPHGVFAVLGPFNFPGHLPNGHLVPALLAGNACVFKPSELAPSVAAHMAAAFSEAGLPAGCICIVNGGREVGEALLAADINGVLFTGSVETGRAIHRRFAGFPNIMLALEMGGNNPLLIWPPVEAEKAAEIAFQSAFITSGQRCSCARRLIVPDDEFGARVIDAIKARIAATKIGAWDEADAYLGPVVTAQAARRALEFEGELGAIGGKQIAPLQPLPIGPAFLRPGLIDMTDASGAPDAELFGPLLQIYRAPSFDAALACANRTQFGLAAGLVCEDEARWRTFIDCAAFGVVNWNRPTTGASSSLPFGGPGFSGNFRPGAYYAADYCAWPQASQVSAGC